MPTWTLAALDLPLRYTWKISRNASTSKTNFVATVVLAGATGRGEAAPNVRYGETPALLQAQFDALQVNGIEKVSSMASLDALFLHQPVAHALRFALEAALTHALAAQAGVPVWAYLGVPAPAAAVPTAFSLPIMEPAAVAGFLIEQNAQRFKLLKVKVSAADGLALLRAVAAAAPGQPLLVDGNETWTTAADVLVFLEAVAAIPGLNLCYLEQPMPAAATAEYERLRPLSAVPLLADESVTDTADFAALARQFHGVNVKLMKAGGYRRGIELLRATRAHGLLPMLGCMVETSLGIASGLHISALAEMHDLDGLLIVRREPFGLVTETAGALHLAG